MTEVQEVDRLSLKSSVIVVTACVIAIIGLAMITRAEDGTISDRGNAALLLGGGGAFAVSGLLLVVKGRELPRDILVLLITLAGLGATAVALVDLAGLRDAGLFLPIPFAVPIVLGLIRLFRRP